jgi:hypothetical protein
MVRAKFIVERFTTTRHSKGAIIELRPVIQGSEENETFYDLTPSGIIELTTVNEEAAKQFEIGKEYYIDFTPAKEV